MNCIISPAPLEGFSNTKTQIVKNVSERDLYLIDGTVKKQENPICPHCGSRLHVHGSADASLNHLPFGNTLSIIRFKKQRYCCPHCHKTTMQEIAFQSESHRITRQLENYCEDLLSQGLTNKMIASITGLGKNTVKYIDQKRLQRLYCDADGKTFRVPEETPSIIGIDEFKLHDGQKYATVIISMETGHILWFQEGKKKKVVYDFIDNVGDAWMDNVEAVCCDMDSDFQEVFEERYDNIQTVFDHFHIVKNFND